MIVALLSARPDAILALAAGYGAEWPDWYGPDGPGDAEADLSERAGAASVPFAVVALEGDRPIGTAAVVTTSIASRAQLTPWLGGLWVAPGARRAGVASAMIEAATTEAQARGLVRLHVATERGRALFERLGWRLVEELDEDDHRLAVLVRDL